MKSWIEIRDENGKRVVDTTPIDEYVDGLRADIGRRKLFKNPQRIHQLRPLSQEQLVHLAAQLTFLVEEYAFLYDGSFSSDHQKLVEQLREVKDAAGAAGVELWPELEE